MTDVDDRLRHIEERLTRMEDCLGPRLDPSPAPDHNPPRAWGLSFTF